MLSQLGRRTSPEWKIRLDQHLPSNPARLNQHLPSDQTRLDQHIPSNPIRLDQHLPSKETRLDQHLPSNQSRQNQHLPSNQIRLKTNNKICDSKRLIHRSSRKTLFNFNTLEIPHYVRGVAEFCVSGVTEQ